MFTGTVRVKICEAQGLRPTDCSKRHNMTFGKAADDQLMDPYVTIDVDDTHVAQTTTRQKTLDPVWNEYFEHGVVNAKTLTLTVFHDAAIPPDVFVANCSIPFEDLLNREKDEADFWVSPSAATTDVNTTKNNRRARAGVTPKINRFRFYRIHTLSAIGKSSPEFISNTTTLALTQKQQLTLSKKSKTTLRALSYHSTKCCSRWR
jgi:Ca2+-dependent lipid-binding protein